MKVERVRFRFFYCMCVQTTPPCTEGLRWHVFTSHIPIPLSTVRNYESKFVNITDPVTGKALTLSSLIFLHVCVLCCEVT
jgi:carbonic anhydrase